MLVIWSHVLINFLSAFPHSQIGSRFISRRLIQKLYDRALTIGLQGYAQLYVALPSYIILY